MNKYALLVSGGVNAYSNYGRYLNDLTEMYKTLVTKCGYPKANIMVLYADGAAHDIDGDGVNEINAAATHANLQSAFTTLQGKVTANDMLFFFSTNHGGQITDGTNNAKLWLWGGPSEYMADSEFAGYINAITSKLTVITMEQCYSGGFIDNLAGPNRVIATACRWDQVSWACDSEGNYDEFCYYWTAAVRGQKPDGTVVDASGGDGKVSLKDAFNYALANDSRTENPQYYENPTGVGSQYTLAGPISTAATCNILWAKIVPPCVPLYRKLTPICQPLVKKLMVPCVLSRKIPIATCGFSHVVGPECGRDMVVDPQRPVGDPVETITTLHGEAKTAYLTALQQMKEAGYSDVEIKGALEQMAGHFYADAQEADATATQLGAGAGTHFRRVTR